MTYCGFVLKSYAHVIFLLLFLKYIFELCRANVKPTFIECLVSTGFSRAGQSPASFPSQISQHALADYSVSGEWEWPVRLF